MWYSRSPFAFAFSFTTLTLFFLGAGTVGYNLNKHDRFVSHTSWTDGPIWWEMGAGIFCAVIAAVAWHRAIRSIDGPPPPESTARHRFRRCRVATPRGRGTAWTAAEGQSAAG